MAGWAVEAGAAAAKARRRMDLLSGEMPLVETGKLPRDELGLMRSGQLNQSGIRQPPHDAALVELRLRSNERLNRPGHVRMATRSQEAVEYKFEQEAAVSEAESDTEISLRAEGLARKGVRLEQRQLAGGGLLQLLSPLPGHPSAPNLQAALLQLPHKTVYAEISSQGSSLLLAKAPNPLQDPNHHLSV